MLKYRSLIFPLAVNCRSWRLFRSNCDGSSLTVTQRLIFSSFHLHWINTLHRRTFKLEGVFAFLFKWRQTWNRQMETETQSWFFLWLCLLNPNTEEGEWFWGDFRDKAPRLTFRHILTLPANLEELPDSTLQVSNCRTKTLKLLRPTFSW